MAKRRLKIIKFEMPDLIIAEPTIKSKDNEYEKNLKKQLKERRKKK